MSEIFPPKQETLFPLLGISSLLTMEKELQDFARNATALMVHMGLTPPRLAAKAGVSVKTVNNVLKGRHAHQADVLTKIAAALETPIWLLYLPDIHEDAFDQTFTAFVQTAARLKPESLSAVKRMADLELKNS